MYFYFKVSEELSSVETECDYRTGNVPIDVFQKNLVVWKRVCTYRKMDITIRVSEELSSVETSYRRYRDDF